MLKQIHDIILELRADNSSNYKLNVLEKHKDNELFKKFLLYVYNPRWNYWITQKPTYISTSVMNTLSRISEQEFFQIFDQLRNREITGNMARDLLNNFYSSLFEDGQELVELILARDLKANVSTKSINKVFSNLIQETPYMRCSPISKVDTNKLFVEGYAYAQKKADGSFNYIIKQDDKVKLLTRAGTEWESDILSERMKHFPNNTVLVGEALIKEEKKELSRKVGNGLITSFVKRYSTLDSLNEKLAKASDKAKAKIELKIKEHLDEWNYTETNLYFEVWDILSIEEFEQGVSQRPYHERLNELNYLVDKSNVKPFIQVIETERIETLEEALIIGNNYIVNGYEGAILKSPTVLWENKTSKEMVKIKAELDCDLLCIDVIEGEGKYKGLIGALVCQSSCGNLVVNVGTGLNDNDRSKDKSEYIGKIIEIKYNEKIKSKDKDTWSLFLPVFIEIREKNKADSLEEIL